MSRDRDAFVLGLDPAFWAYNLGDQIISQAAWGELEAITRDVGLPLIRGGWHDSLGRRGKAVAREAQAAVQVGANSLSSLLPTRSVARYGPVDALAIAGKVVLFGVGAASAAPLDPYSRVVWKRILDRSAPHSVRDATAATQLVDLGIPGDRVFLTGCPTTWNLDLVSPPAAPAERVLYLGSAKDEPHLAQRMVDALRRHYGAILTWHQTVARAPHAVADVTEVRGGLVGLDALLASPEPLDVVGTRLHGGVRALQHGRRSLIFAIDHRAGGQAEVSGLPVAGVENLDAEVDRFAAGGWELAVTPPTDVIKAWREQLAVHLKVR